MRSGRWALAAVLLLPLAVRAADTPKALTAARQQVESADYRLSGHLVRVDGNGARTSYPITIKAHWFPGVLRIMLGIGNAPKTDSGSFIHARAATHILLEMRPGGGSTILIAHPGDQSPIALPFDKWSDGPLGHGFSYEDFLEANYFWAGQTALGEAKFGARNCDLVRSTPGAADKTHYTDVKSWFDHGIGLPVYIEKTLKGGRVKEFTYYGLRQNGGVWSASQVEARIRGRGGSTLLVVERGTPKAKLGLKDFSLVQLTHF